MRDTKTYTVTISGAEREDGEAPFTWVVEAASEAQGVAKAMEHHLDALGLDDEYDVRVEGVFQGAPSADCGYAWNDRRSPRR